MSTKDIQPNYNRTELVPTINEVLSDPCTSGWLRKSLTLALLRDPIDAANEAAFLSSLLANRADQILGWRK